MKKRYVAFGCTGLGVLGAGLGAVLGIGVGLVVVLAVLPGMAKTRIEALVADQLRQNVDADVTFGSVDISLVASFPRLRVRFRDVTVQGHAPFEDVRLADIPELQVKVGLLSALSGQTVTVKSVSLTDPKIRDRHPEGRADQHRPVRGVRGRRLHRGRTVGHRRLAPRARRRDDHEPRRPLRGPEGPPQGRGERPRPPAPREPVGRGVEGRRRDDHWRPDGPQGKDDLAPRHPLGR